MRVSALEQENRDLLQQAAVRDAKLEQYKNDRVLPDGMPRHALFLFSHWLTVPYNPQTILVKQAYLC